MTRTNGRDRGDTYPRALIWEAAKTFLRVQASRAMFRIQVLRLAVTALAFWTLVGAGYLWLDARGFGLIFGTLVAVWLILMLPTLLLQLGLFVDVLNYWLTGRVLIFPKLIHMAGAGQRRARARGEMRTPLLVRLAVSAGLTSPFSGLSLWCYGVLIRVPRSAHALEPRKPAQPRARQPRRSRQVAGPWRGAQREYWTTLGKRTTSELASV